MNLYSQEHGVNSSDSIANTWLSFATAAATTAATTATVSVSLAFSVDQ